jgi:hypothetical protein
VDNEGVKPRVRIALVGGRADLRRAPVRDLVLLLSEFQDLVLDVGRSFATPETPDEVVERSCRIEIVALSYGSLAPELELASFLDDEPNPIGLRAMEEASRLFSLLRDATVPNVPPELVVHIDHLGGLLDHGYNRIDVVYSHNGLIVKGVLDETLRAKLLSEQASAIAVEDVSVRGILFALEDRPTERERHVFSATLLDDAGQLWSVRFGRSDTDEARRLWRNKVELTGTARYSRARRPQLSVKRAQLLPETSWEEALARHHGAWKDLFRGTSFDDVVNDLR